MGNIVGEGFNKKIIEQIKQRQKIYGSINRDNEQLNYLNSKTGWCKLVSGVSVDSEVINVRKLDGLSSGDNLAKDYVLFGGMRGGPNTYRVGVAEENKISSGGAYGFGGTEFGLRPMPGIMSIAIQTETRGSIKKATVRIQANNRAQFDVVDILYMRLGYSLLLEWGNSSYFDNDGTYIKENLYSLEDQFLNQSYSTTAGPADLNYSNILSVIEDYRLLSNGNYDALFCKVVNFSWTFTKEGKYDITLNLISLGDVIESLKANVLYSGQPNNYGGIPTPNTSSFNPPPNNANISPIIAFKETHEIGKYFYSIYTALEPVGVDYTGIANIALPTNNNSTTTIAFKQIFSNGPSIYYIRLGHFLNFLKDNILYNINDDPTRKILKINTDVKSNIIHLLNNQVGADLNVCIFKCKFTAPGATIYFATPKGDEFVHTYGTDNQYGYLMNAYFSLEYILNELDNKKDKNGKTSIYDLLTSLCDGWNQATGHYNKLEITVDSETNEARFTDSVLLPDRDTILGQLDDPDISIETALFDTYGYVYSGSGDNFTSSAGFIRDLSFTTTVSPDLATMITVGSTNHGYVVGEDSTALSRMNLGITDRYKETINPPIPSGQTNQNTNEPLYVRYVVPFRNFILFLNDIGYTIFNNGTQTTPQFSDPVTIKDFSQIQAQLIEYEQAYNTAEAARIDPTAASPNAGFLPFNLSLTLDGLSGMKVYQKFTIESDFLPTNYPRSLEFLIKGIKNRIENNQWITEIDSFCIAKNPFGAAGVTSSVSIRATSSIPAITANNTIITTNVPPPASNTPLLTKAVTDQSQYVFNTRLEELGRCANYTYNIAYKIKEHIDNRSNTSIPFGNVSSGGNANENSHRQFIKNLGLYDEYYLGTFTIPQLKQWISSKSFNYGDILNYYSPDNSGPSNMHSQIYTGTIFNRGISRRGIVGNSGWSTSARTNYGVSVVYSNNLPFNVYYYQVKPQYQI